MACPLWVKNRHVRCTKRCLLRANSGLMRRSKQRLLFDHLVCDWLELDRYVEAYRFGGLEVDDKLILRRRLYRHVGRLLPLEDTVDVAGRAPVQIGPIKPIGGQTAGNDEGAIE